MASTDLELNRECWDQFAVDFETYFEPQTVLQARSLLAMLRLSESVALLEVGAGAGGAAAVAARMLPPTARHVVTDFSPGMLRLARKKLGSSIEIREANAEELPFADGEFDRYLSNLALMLVPDAGRALREAHRVLTPGGMAAWNVWGRPENSPLFTIVPLAAKKAGIKMPEPERSNFHLGDAVATRDRLQQAGFEAVLTWYAPLALPVHSGAEYAALMLGAQNSLRTFLETQPADSVDRLRAELTAAADAELARGRPICFENLSILARKPSPK